MELTRYDGTRFITEEEIDKEFTGKYALLRLESKNSSLYEGYLVAVAENNSNGYSILGDIGMDEYDGKATIIYGCAERGVDIHVEILD
ncbi:MAG: hypothetical protein FWG65_02765 [Turicibacter sp.]|nr:hypothetical protein [Turicibacter sp.]